MKAILLAGSLIGAAFASSHERHMGFHNHHNKRSSYGLNLYSPDNSTCGCTTYTTYFYGEPTLVPKPVEPSTSSTPPAYTPPPPPPAAYTPPPPPPAPKVLDAVANLVTGGGGGNKWAMTYTPYNDAGNCKTAGEVMNDLKQIKQKGFSCVRTYSTDCSGLQNIGAAAEAHGLKIIAGVYINGQGIGAAKSQVQDIIRWAKFHLVELVVIGNESIFNHWTTAELLAAFIAEAKGQLKAAGYNGPVTTTEPVNIMSQIGHKLCGVIDVIGANIHAYFNSETKAENAGDFILRELELLAKICPGKPTYNLETGWPVGGKANGAAVPGKAQQKAAINSILAKAGAKSVVFSFGNDYWKDPGSYGVEQFFGCLDIF